jgi:uroporphyrinogen-III synthase
MQLTLLRAMLPMSWASRWQRSCAHKALTETTLLAMRVIITRPAGDAPAWLDALQAAGYKACSLPLIEVGPARHTQAVAQAWAQWPNFQAVMFVSAQAVRYFFQNQPAGYAWASAPRCWATGPGTHKALLQAGVPEVFIDSPAADAAQFDSEALWQRVAAQVKAGQPVLIVRGKDVSFHVQAAAQANTDHAEHSSEVAGTGRDWLAQQLQAAGAAAQFVVAYERRAPTWSAEQQALAAQAASDGTVWCFSSSQAIHHLAQAMPSQSWAKARCIATHPRIAQTARALGFGEIQMTKPSLADLLVSLESLA